VNKGIVDDKFLVIAFVALRPGGLVGASADAEDTFEVAGGNELGDGVAVKIIESDKNVGTFHQNMLLPVTSKRVGLWVLEPYEFTFTPTERTLGASASYNIHFTISIHVFEEGTVVPQAFFGRADFDGLGVVTIEIEQLDASVRLAGNKESISEGEHGGTKKFLGHRVDLIGPSDIVSHHFEGKPFGAIVGGDVAGEVDGVVSERREGGDEDGVDLLIHSDERWILQQDFIDLLEAGGLSGGGQGEGQ